MKKFVSWIIIVMLLIPIIITNASAIEYSDVKSEELEKAYDILYAYNIFKGYPDGTFRPSNLVTRAEMAKVVVVLIGYDDYEEGLTSIFPDAKGHWAEKYISLLTELGIIRGYEDGTYRPNSYVSATEAITIILRVLGYDQNLLSKNSKLMFDNEFAKNLGLLNGVYNQTDDITRENLLKMVYNSLSLNKVLVKNDAIVRTETSIMDYLGRVENEKITLKMYNEHKEYDLSNYLLNKGNVYYDKTGNIVLVRELEYSSIKANVVSTADSKVVIARDIYGNNALYDLNNVDIIFNGATANFSAKDLKNSEVIILFNSEYKTNPVGIVATKVTDVQIVMEDDKYKAGSSVFMGKRLPKKNGAVSLENITVFGAVNHINNIKENDVLYFYETLEENANSKLMIDVVRNTANGIYNGIEEINYQKYYVIGDKRYLISDAYLSTEELSIGDKVIAYLDKTESIVREDVVAFAKEPETYAVVYSVSDQVDNGKLPTIRTVNQQGAYKTYTLRENCGLVTKTELDGKTVYITSIKAGDVIKYDKFDDNNIKIAKKVDTSYIGGRFNIANGRLLDNGGIINKDTIILIAQNGSYRILPYTSLGDNLKGRGFVNSNGIVEFILISENNFTVPEEPEEPEESIDSSITNEPETPTVTTFTGSEIGVIKEITNTNGVTKLKLFDIDYVYTVDSNISINSYKNKLVTINVVNDVITSIKAYTPEISQCLVTGVFKGQLQIDNISYVEYSTYVRVFKTTKDLQGNIIEFKSVSINEVVNGLIVNLYNINNNYSGVMDVIVIN